MIDGRKRRHLKLNRRSYPPVQDIARTYANQFSRPDTDSSSIAAAGLLARTKAYELLRLLSNKKQKQPNIDPALRDELIQAGIIAPTNIGGFFELTPLGNRMNIKSHWMTVWLSNILIAKGVAESQIFIGIGSEGEEVDLLVTLPQEVWIFELKAGDFQPNKAYPFQYRKVQFEAKRIFAIATGSISISAKKVFARLAGEVGPGPVMIEGLDKVDAVLTQSLIEANLRVVKEKEKTLSNGLGIRLATLFTHFFYENH